MTRKEGGGKVSEVVSKKTAYHIVCRKMSANNAWNSYVAVVVVPPGQHFDPRSTPLNTMLLAARGVQVFQVGSFRNGSTGPRSKYAMCIAHAQGIVDALVANDGHGFKQVGVHPETGHLLSVYDCKTEYVLGRNMRRMVKPRHEGGLYVYRTLHEAREADVPIHYPSSGWERAIIICRIGGKMIAYAGGKLAVSSLTPVKVVEYIPQ